MGFFPLLLVNLRLHVYVKIIRKKNQHTAKQSPETHMAAWLGLSSEHWGGLSNLQNRKNLSPDGLWIVVFFLKS